MINKHKKYKRLFVAALLLSFATVWMATDANRFLKIARSMETFSDAFKTANQDYVDATDPNMMMRVAIDSMLGSIDPYTNYFSEAQMERVRINYKGFWDGVGFEIIEHNGKIIVSDVFEETPASAAGVFIGDELISIDGAKFKDKKVEDIEQSLHGKAGTQVMVKLRCPANGIEKELNLTRGKISRKNVPFHAMLDENTAYIVLNTFTERAGANVADALKELQEDFKPKQVILDLRDNGGGLLIEAVNLCNVFVPKGFEIVATRNRVADWDRPFTTLNTPVDTKIPLIILINERSASASEIVAGAIQDLDRGVLLGRRSFGKGLVQNTYDIGYNSKVKLTTARYYIPSGRCIQALEYKDGKSVRINDTLQRSFITKNGRPVSDGGGLRPDFDVTTTEYYAILKSLTENKVIFEFANKYRAEHDSILKAEDFNMSETEYTDFLTFLEKGNYKYGVEAEAELNATIAKAKGEGNYLLLKKQFDIIQKNIEDAKKQDLIKYKEKLKEAIEEEIVSRYYYEKGKIQLRLKRDKDVQEAIKLFANPEKYKKLLAAPEK